MSITRAIIVPYLKKSQILIIKIYFFCKKIATFGARKKTHYNLFMKKLLLSVVIALLSCVTTSCTIDTLDLNTPAGYTALTVGMPDSRTSLGDKDANGIYAVYWSEGDQIVANGVPSASSVIGDDKKSATFLFEVGKIEAPYNLTYPYTEGSECSKDRPTVVFAAEQEYMTGTFGIGYAPMYGHCGSGDNSATVKHLAGIMRLAVKGSTTLSTIEVVAEEGVALAGEFDVDCQTGEISAIEGKTTNKVTYIVEETLSTAEATTFHIAIPAGDLGVCRVILTDNAGLKMNLKWNASGVTAGVVREFKEFSFKGGASFELQAMTSIVDGLTVTDDHEGVWGYIKYDDGTPAVGVSVSDGFSVVVTNQIGFYQFKNGVDSRTKHIYYSLPSTAQVKVNSSKHYINIFKKYYSNTYRYDFTLTKIEKEENFSLFVLADTHGARAKYLTRLSAECVPGLKRERERRGASHPCYTIICGDIVCASTSTEVDEEKIQASYYMPQMLQRFDVKNTANTPTFYVMGNHDHDRNYFDTPPYSNYDEFQYHIQDAYENNFGPANYSFNRGDTHIICMRDIFWPEDCIKEKNSLGCYPGFSDEQLAWLKADLTNVPKTNKVILCVHIPLFNYYASTDTKYKNVKNVIDAISVYNEPQIFSGHNHRNIDYKASGKSGYTSPVSEKAIVGNWGTGSTATANGFGLRCMGDGSPFGFDVYDVSGAKFTDHYFVDCTSQKCHKVDDDYVMRAYLSSDVYGGDSTGDGAVYTYSTHVSHERYFKFYDAGSSKRQLRVNVFNGSPDTWTLELYINGTKAGNLTWLASNAGSAWSNCSPYETTESGVAPFTWKGSGSGTATSPWYPSSVNNSQDWWYISYAVNETSAGKQIVNSTCHHMWYYVLTSTQLSYINKGKFYIKAIHKEFGVTKTYTTDKIFKHKDLNGYINYNAKNE